MVLTVLSFIVGAGAVMGAYFALTALPGVLERRRLERRLFDVSAPVDKADETSLVKRPSERLPIIDRLFAKSEAGPRLSRLIDQSGVKTTPSTVLVMSLGAALGGGLLVLIFTRQIVLAPLGALITGVLPIGFLLQRRGARLRKFEEYFPEALDLMARALRAGHAFQTAMGMAGDELKEPVGPEFKKAFDQQNFGLPLKDALHQLTERVPILDVRFFVTAVLIQRETGGNLSEILENLAHVVRERFKIRRQVRVHTAHGRFTAGVLLSLPPAMGVMLSMINPEHMDLLFKERLGQTMIMAAIVMQTIGFFWIRKVIKIEV